VNNYRNLTKVKSIKAQMISVEGLFNNAIDLFKHEFDPKNIEFQVEIETSNYQIFADSRLIEQVLINLIKNASEALIETEHKLIKLKAYHQENFDCIEITDNGCGIPSDKYEQIFIPFFTTKNNGSGIGLSLSRQIMRLHKGDIQVESSIKNGTTVRLKF
jgi:two-component system, NtrC family, nitrogen regulation sensor histidine kinase NtrY